MWDKCKNRSSRYIHVLFYDISNALLWIILSYYLSWTANKWLNWIMEVVVDIKRRHAEQENSSSVHFYSLIVFIITFFQTVLTQTLRENGFWKSCRKLKVPMKSKLSPWNESFLGVSINMLVLRLSISQCAPKQWQNSHLGDISIQSWQFVTSAKMDKSFFLTSPRISASHQIFWPIKCSLESEVPATYTINRRWSCGWDR